jgi:hypothetical protein
MSYSFTQSGTQSFTSTHAKHLASKVATDLKRMQRFYGYPSDVKIAEFELELIELLKNGYLDTVTYGFKRNGNWIEPTIRYTSRDLQGLTSVDDDPGRVRPNADVAGGSFYSFLTYNWSYLLLSDQEKENFKTALPFQRGTADEPGINGYLSSDKTYSSGGRALDRSSVKSY